VRAQQVPHHRVKRWLEADAQQMSSRTYRAQALAQLSHSLTFNHRERYAEMRQASMEASVLSEEGGSGHDARPSGDGGSPCGVGALCLLHQSGWVLMPAIIFQLSSVCINDSCTGRVPSGVCDCQQLDCLGDGKNWVRRRLSRACAGYEPPEVAGLEGSGTGPQGPRGEDLAGAERGAVMLPIAEEQQRLQASWLHPPGVRHVQEQEEASMGPADAGEGADGFGRVHLFLKRLEGPWRRLGVAVGAHQVSSQEPFLPLHSIDAQCPGQRCLVC
jgi:hypothetical protein